MHPVELLSALRTRRLVAIVRGADADAALDTVLALVGAGVDLVEISLSGSDALRVIERARAALGPDVALGAGTVLTARDARRAAEAGAAYTVTPGVTEAVAASRQLGLPVLAGALTPTEVAAAVSEGATAVKLFPAGLGGVSLLRALRAPFPDVPFVPVGGVDATAAREYLAAGALAVGVGSPLVGAAADGDPTGLTERAAQFRSLATATPEGARGTAHIAHTNAHAPTPPPTPPSGARGTAHTTDADPHQPTPARPAPSGARGTAHPTLTDPHQPTPSTAAPSGARGTAHPAHTDPHQPTPPAAPHPRNRRATS